MNSVILPFEHQFVEKTKELIAEVILEFYADLEFLPKTKGELLAHYGRIGYLDDIDNWKSVYSPPNGSFLVLADRNSVVGCGGIRRLDQNSCELTRLWLKKGYRKMGFGRQLFDKLLAASRKMGYERINLDTSDRCADGIRLFRMNGFVECEKYKESVGNVFLTLDLSDSRILG